MLRRSLLQHGVLAWQRGEGLHARAHACTYAQHAMYGHTPKRRVVMRSQGDLGAAAAEGGHTCMHAQSTCTRRAHAHALQQCMAGYGCSNVWLGMAAAMMAVHVLCACMHVTAIPAARRAARSARAHAVQTARGTWRRHPCAPGQGSAQGMWSG